MIVTRHRKRRVNLGPLLVPLAALALLAAALLWPPSHRAIADGPLKPVWTVAAHTGAAIERPFSFAAQQQSIADRNREIRDLNGRLDEQRAAKVAADARADELAQRLTSLANQPRETPAPLPRPTSAVAAAAFGAPSSAAGAGSPTAEEKRLAATWAAMEPEKAAAVLQHLPDETVTRVLGQMDADSAGAIMDALPTATAARISRAVAQVSPGAGR